jgi:hypothetical protein
VNIRISTFDSNLSHITDYNIPIVAINSGGYFNESVYNASGDVFIISIYNFTSTVYHIPNGFTTVSSSPLSVNLRYSGGATCDLLGNAVYTVNYITNINIIIISITPALAINWTTSVAINPAFFPPKNSAITVDTSGNLYLLYSNTGNGLILNLAMIDSSSGSIIGTTQVNYPPPLLTTPVLLEYVYATINNYNRFFYMLVIGGSPTSCIQYGELDLSGNVVFSNTIYPTSATSQYAIVSCDNTMSIVGWFFTTQFEIAYIDVSCVTFDVSQCSYVYPGCACPVIAQPVIQQPTTPNQLTHILDQVVACPILYVTPFATSGCQPVYTEPIPPLLGPDVEPPQGPAVMNVYRKFSRISGIDQISKPLVGRSASDRTARLRANLVSQSQTRYVQTVIPLIAYPPCLPPPPQPGVPIAPNTGCNLGARRVDFSNPKA